MSATIELKYFNTFWLKRMKNLASATANDEPILPTFNDPLIPENVPLSFTYGVDAAETYDININTLEDWMIEESRIRGGYNNQSVDFGVKAYLVEDESKQTHKASGLIHSGIFNSRTGINQTNQFSVGEDITRTIDPANGSIQKLYAEDTNLIIFQEEKVSKSLIDKDAIYSAEGNASVTSRNLVIGQNVAFGGEYGISKDPESFAVNGYRKYFTDREQNVVCRLSMDGITVISNYGMIDFFRDKLADVTSQGIVHYILEPSSTTRSVFYGTPYDSDVTIVFNSNPSMIKNFQTVNYEGSSGWEMDSFITDTDTALAITPNILATSLTQMQNNTMSNNFKLKENKYFANLVNSSPSQFGEVVWGSSSSGLKGFYGEVKMKMRNSSNVQNAVGKKELFAISTGFVPSSY